VSLHVNSAGHSLEQNTGNEWQPLIGGLEVAMDRGAEDDLAAEEDDELATGNN